MLVKKQKQSDSFTPLSRLRLKSKRFYLKGFTVLELLIVIAIVGIITSVLLVAFKGAMERARIAQGWQFSDSLRGALQMDMVAWWPLDRIYAGFPPTTPDSWFDRNDGTVYGATSTEGIVNGALSFNGSSDYVDCGEASKLKITDALTIEVWVYLLSAPNNYATIVTRLSNIFHSYWFAINGSGSPILYLEGVGNFFLYDAAIAFNKWNHVAVTYDKNGGENNVRAYVNGRLEDYKTGVGSIGTTGTNFALGYGRYGYWFDGLMDEVRIYNAVLPSVAIQQHYVEGLKRHQNLVKR